MDMLFVECVDGKPYSKWWDPIAERQSTTCEHNLYGEDDG